MGVSRFGSVTDKLTRILLRKQGLHGAVNMRQMGGTTEIAAAFQRRQISGAVMSMLRVDAPMRMLVDLDQAKMIQVQNPYFSTAAMALLNAGFSSPRVLTSR